jgi:hypothetical protein
LPWASAIVRTAPMPSPSIVQLFTIGPANFITPPKSRK